MTRGAVSGEMPKRLRSPPAAIMLREGLVVAPRPFWPLVTRQRALQGKPDEAPHCLRMSEERSNRFVLAARYQTRIDEGRAQLMRYFGKLYAKPRRATLCHFSLPIR